MPSLAPASPASLRSSSASSLGRRVGALALTAALVLGGAACGSSKKAQTSAKAPIPQRQLPTSSTTPQVQLLPVSSGDPGPYGAPASITSVAQAQIPSVDIYDKPDGTVTATLSNPNEDHAPLVFVVVSQEVVSGVVTWLMVQLPVRPNGSTGWIKANTVSTSQHTYRIDVSVSQHKIIVMNGAQVVDEESVGLGTTDTPTPGGSFYTKELLQPLNPNGDYGPYAYGLSGFSDQLLHYNGGSGVIGIHGTNHPELIGKNVSHGCIRMSNAGITKLARLLPLGVPVRILT